jgi:uncharacterized membrane protein
MSALRPVLLTVLLFAAGCHHADQEGKAALPGGEERAPWSGLDSADTLHFTGTEPFWGGTLTGATLVWQTPEESAGQTLTVKRFAGRNGLGVSGTLTDAPFDMAVSQAACSDGMSDRSYPFTVTVKRGSETLRGCGWSEAHPFTGPARP